jgi:hypothetical protein
VLGHEVVHEHVEGHHPDLGFELGHELGGAGALPDHVFVPLTATWAGDLVEDLAVPLCGGDRVTVLLAEVGVERTRPSSELAPRAAQLTVRTCRCISQASYRLKR